MHPLWKVLNLTSSFKYQGDIWTVVEDNNMDLLMARNERTQCIDPFSLYCRVEPCGIDMGTDMEQEDPLIVERLDNQKLVEEMRAHMIKHGTRNMAKVLREVILVHVGWNSDFTELDSDHFS